MWLQATAGNEQLAAILDEFVAGVVATIPRVLSGVLFLVLAYGVIRVVLGIVRSVLARLYPADQRIVVDLAVTVVGVFLWFAAALGLLRILGMGEVAASLGTASGFIGLGVAFALKEMIADTMAGVYLIRDPDFSEGDQVDTASTSGTIVGIDLRKTRLRSDDGDLVVLANRDVEKQWTKEGHEAVDGAA